MYLQTANPSKSAVSRPWLRKFLGFTYFHMCGQATVRIHGKTLKRFKDKVRELTSRGRGKSLKQVIQELNQQFLGWWGYFRLTEAKSFLKGLRIWIRRRLRNLVWKQWKNPKTRVANLEKLGIAHEDAMLRGNARKKYWRMSKIKWAPLPCLKATSLSGDYTCRDTDFLISRTALVRDPYAGWCGRALQ